jgi:DNA-binding beta-propeller fold protein YncE
MPFMPGPLPFVLWNLPSLKRAEERARSSRSPLNVAIAAMMAYCDAEVRRHAMRTTARCIAIAFLLAPAACACSNGLAAQDASASGRAVELPGGAPGVGFDDLPYAPDLHRLLVPAGRSGRLNLVDPDSLAVTSVSGFAKTGSYSGGHDDGPTSADAGGGKIYVIDRTSKKLNVVDPAKAEITASASLTAGPDYVRFVAPTNEVWVTQPDAAQIEVFKLGTDGRPVHDGVIPVANGPESIVVDAARGRVYTHRWTKTTVAIDIHKRAIVGEWPNGCAGSRGIALDAPHGWLLTSCSEGKVSVLDVAHGGKVLSSAKVGAGLDVIGYAPRLGHVYVAGGACACFAILGVDAGGQLSLLKRGEAPPHTHCAGADDSGHAWVCDPGHGRVLRIDDQAPSSSQR